ncbi:hypothetical protein IE81DRAFT_175969 [Ceraceosorus guamensis]|uniref:Uncharacterized protein n=1 Tax=Ceraceosorus guamensis TaxID=1522189 RepID=A0A316VUW6_9BASI|nr:hypothetical protein IE81DRAFT_175969 [Ceraceosorus guamensis]PWN41416.1 hypothetical protein IE81DRAFT_175969 [Ceraceosorus guamensis]
MKKTWGSMRKHPYRTAAGLTGLGTGGATIAGVAQYQHMHDQELKKLKRPYQDEIDAYMKEVAQNPVRRSIEDIGSSESQAVKIAARGLPQPASTAFTDGVHSVFRRYGVKTAGRLSFPPEAPFERRKAEDLLPRQVELTSIGKKAEKVIHLGSPGGVKPTKVRRVRSFTKTYVRKHPVTTSVGAVTGLGITGAGVYGAVKLANHHDGHKAQSNGRADDGSWANHGVGGGVKPGTPGTITYADGSTAPLEAYKNPMGIGPQVYAPSGPAPAPKDAKAPVGKFPPIMGIGPEVYVPDAPAPTPAPSPAPNNDPKHHRRSLPRDEAFASLLARDFESEHGSYIHERSASSAELERRAGAGPLKALGKIFTKKKAGPATKFLATGLIAGGAIGGSYMLAHGLTHHVAKNDAKMDFITKPQAYKWGDQKITEDPQAYVFPTGPTSPQNIEIPITLTPVATADKGGK